MNLFDAAIVNYNTCGLLRDCLESVIREAPGRVIVVDNASPDGSALMVRAEFPFCQIIENPNNAGYGRAANQAVRASSAKYILLLNSDTRVAAGALTALSDYLERHPQVGIAGPRLSGLDGELQRSCFPFPTLADLFLDVSHLSQLIGRVPGVREGYARSWSHDRDRRVPWVSGAALAIRRKAFDEVHGFDESFYMYYEETDLCYRMAQANWEIHFTPAAEIAHVGGASARQRPAEMTVQLYASLAHFYHLHYTPAHTSSMIGWVRCVALARLLRDRAALRLARDTERQTILKQKITAWQRLIQGAWQQQVMG